MKRYIQFAIENIKSILERTDPKQEPKSSIDAEKNAERLNALRSNLRKIQIDKIPVYITTNAASQAVVRRSDLEPGDWEVIIKRIINNVKHNTDGYYLYYSKSYDQGIVIYWNNSEFYIVTVLPKGRANPKPGTDKILIERNDISHGFGLTPDNTQFNKDLTLTLTINEIE